MATESEQETLAHLASTVKGVALDLGVLSHSDDPALAELAKTLQQQQALIADGLARAAEGFCQPA